MPENSADKVLCIDDEDNILQVFQRTLGRKFNLYTANSGEKALELLKEHGDIAVILCDYNMPAMNGIEFLQQASRVSPDSVQMMLTGNIQLEVVVEAINTTEIFRYIPKPCRSEVLEKVIDDALDQYHLVLSNRRMTLELAEKNAALAKQSYQQEYELEMAKTVYGKIIFDNCLETEGLEFLMAAKDAVGGDFLRTYSSEDGPFFVMLGDLTGHGLQSALATLLVTEAFDAACSENPNVELLAQHINEKMCNKLPRDLFCAAILLKLDFVNDQMNVWQGGLPDAYLLDAEGHVIEVLSSRNLPLGILASRCFAETSNTYKISEFSSVFAYSDGVIEQECMDQSMFGTERLQQALSGCPSDQRRVDYLLDVLRNQQQNIPQSDDICLAELNVKRLMH